MKRSGALFAALIVIFVWLSGCSGPTPEQRAIKDAFIGQLVGYCAQVNRQLEGIDQKTHPGIYADQFAQFADEARRQPAPDLNRKQFKIMLTKIDALVGEFRSAQAALITGNRSEADRALKQASRKYAEADAAAQKYGMPPLNTCPQHESGTSPPARDPAAGSAPAAGWLPRHEAAVAVQQVNATVLDGRIWVAGGLTESGEATASTQFYDPAINSWGQGPPLPEPVHHAMLVNYRNQLAVIGGFHSRGNDLLAVTSARMLLLDNNTGKWVDGPALRHPRAAGGAAVIGGKIIVVGGRVGNPEQLVTQTEVYDGNRWRDAANIPVPGDHLAVTADSSYLYTVGGRKFSAGSNTAAVQRYDPKANRWTARTPTPQPVGGAGAAIVNGRLIVVGGEKPTSVSGTVQAYDLSAPTATWTTLPSLDPGRHGLGVTAIGNTLYAVGGATKPGHTASTNLVEALAVPARRPHAAAAWWPRHEAAVAVQQVNASVLDGRVWVAGGVTSSGEATASTQFYDPAINSWDQGPPLPEPLNHAMLVTYHDQLVVIGGFHGRGHDLLAETSARMLLLDNETGKWVDGPPLGHPRGAGGAAVVGDKIVVVGGRTGNPEQLVTQTEVYDGTSWRDAPDIPVPGDHLAVTADSSYLYAVGGRKFSASSNTDAVQRYDPQASRWTILTPTPQPVGGAGVTVVEANSSSSAAKSPPASPALSRPTT